MFQLFNGKLLKNADATERGLILSAKPLEYAKSFLGTRGAAQRQSYLGESADSSIWLTIACLEVTRGRQQILNPTALSDALHHTGHSKGFTEVCVYCGLADKALHAQDESSGDLQMVTSFLQECYGKSAKTPPDKSYQFFVPLNLDSEAVQYAASHLDSFADNTRAFDAVFNQLTTSDTLHEKLEAAAHLYLIVNADSQTRREIVEQETSIWVEYGITDVDRELLSSWFPYCDPFLQGQYFLALSRSLVEYPAHAPFTREVLALLTAEHMQDGMHTEDARRGASIGDAMLEELKILGFAFSSPELAIKTHIERIGDLDQPHAINNAEAFLRKGITQIINYLIDEDLLQWRSSSSSLESINDRDKSSLTMLLPDYFSKALLANTEASIKARTIPKALALKEPLARSAALMLLSDPTSERFEQFLAACPEPALSTTVISGLLPGPLHEKALHWLLDNSGDTLETVKQSYMDWGFLNEQFVRGALSVVALEPFPDHNLCTTLLQDYKRAHSNVVVQSHIIRALSACQTPELQQQCIKLFTNARNNSVLRADATRGLAMCGGKGLDILESALFSQRDTQHRDGHGRTAITLTPDQEEILISLHYAGAEGAKIVQRFLANRPEDIRIKLVRSFMRSTGTNVHGVPTETLFQLFNEYCSRGSVASASIKHHR